MRFARDFFSRPFSERVNITAKYEREGDDECCNKCTTFNDKLLINSL